MSFINPQSGDGNVTNYRNIRILTLLTVVEAPVSASSSLLTEWMSPRGVMSAVNTCGKGSLRESGELATKEKLVQPAYLPPNWWLRKSLREVDES